jgi:hypothetical protein
MKRIFHVAHYRECPGSDRNAAGPDVDDVQGHVVVRIAVRPAVDGSYLEAIPQDHPRGWRREVHFGEDSQARDRQASDRTLKLECTHKQGYRRSSLPCHLAPVSQLIFDRVAGDTRAVLIVQSLRECHRPFRVARPL